MIQLKTNMPSSENVAQVCSHDQFLTSVMGSTKVPWSKPASSTSRKPATKVMGVFLHLQDEASNSSNGGFQRFLSIARDHASLPPTRYPAIPP
jgi:hypothetical protein